MEKFRAPAVPLVTHDPFFSVWSFADKLTDDVPRHWTGRIMPMTGFVKFDGKSYLFCGTNVGTNYNYNGRSRILEQTDVTVTPTSSIYTFEHKLFELVVVG